MATTFEHFVSQWATQASPHNTKLFLRSFCLRLNVLCSLQVLQKWSSISQITQQLLAICSSNLYEFRNTFNKLGLVQIYCLLADIFHFGLFISGFTKAFPLPEFHSTFLKRGLFPSLTGVGSYNPSLFKIQCPC